MRNTKTTSERITQNNGAIPDPVEAYYESVKLACEIEDQAYLDLLKMLIKRDKAHVERAKIKRAKIEQLDQEISG